MSEKTVTIEFTEEELGFVVMARPPYRWSATLTAKMDTALAEFRAARESERERREKIDALYQWDEDSFTDDWENAKHTLNQLNMAGWDLVRIPSEG